VISAASTGPTTAGDAASTLVAPSQLNSVKPSAATKKFLTGYRKAAKQDATFLSGQAYDNVHLIAAAAKRAGCKTDPDSLVKGMNGLRYTGVNGKYAYSSGYKGGPLRSSFFFITYKNGKQVFAR
jgi:ABC-type branched-subunit amino acid transport system substrate-binding protein